MHQRLWIGLAWLVCVAPQLAEGHGIPVLVDAQAAQLTTDKSVYLTELESFGGQVLLADLPGYTVELGSIIPAGTPLHIAGGGSLLYWSPSTRAIADTPAVLTLANLIGDELKVAACSPPQSPGVSLGAYNGSSEWHRHVDYLLDPPSSPTGAYAVPLSVEADGFAASAPFLLVLGYYGNGFTAAMLNEAVAELLEAQNLYAGDFNQNCSLDVQDIELLSAAVRAGQHEGRYDLSADQRVDEDDRVVWVEELAQTYFGDANLDGEFSSGDLVGVFQAGEYEDDRVANSTWGSGDWSGDQEFNSTDFVRAFQAGGYEVGPRSNLVIVPEPGTVVLASLGLSFCLTLGRRRQAI